MKIFTHPQLFRPIMLSTLAMLVWNFPTLADSGITPLAQVINPGTLSLTQTDSADLSAVTLSHTAGQTSYGSLGQSTVDDSRGGEYGWDLTATATNLVSYGTFTEDDGSPSPFTVYGLYYGTSDADYTLETQGGDGGDRINQLAYQLTGPDGVTTGTLGPSRNVGTSGLSFNAADISYQPWTDYHLHIHIIPASGLTITPGDVTTLAGSPDGVTAGFEHTLAGTSDPATIMTAALGYGDGLYQAGADLRLDIPAGTHPGTYNGRIVETVN